MTGSTDFAIGIDGVPDGFAPATARGLENVVARYQRQGGKTPPHLSCNRDSMRALVASLGGDGAPCETEPLAAWRGIPVFIDEGAAGGIIRATAPMDAPDLAVPVRAHDAPGLWAMMRRAMDLAREDDIIDGFASLALPYYVRDHDTGDEDPQP